MLKIRSGPIPLGKSVPYDVRIVNAAGVLTNADTLTLEQSGPGLGGIVSEVLAPITTGIYRFVISPNAAGFREWNLTGVGGNIDPLAQQGVVEVKPKNVKE